MTRFVACVAIAFLTACSEQPTPEKENIRPIDWVQVQAKPIEQVRRLAGTVEPVETANLSFLVGGKVASVDVVLGQEVSVGQPLAKLDQRSFSLNYQTAEAQLQQANATFQEAQNEYNRYAELVKEGVVSQSGFDNAKAAYESALSARNVAQSRLDLSLKDIQDSTLQAPYEGVITRRMVEPSQQISPGQTVFEIEGQDGLEVQISVPETLIQMISVGTVLPIHFPALPGETLDGIVSEVGVRAETANAFPVTLVLANSPAQLRAGMTAEVDVSYQGQGRTGYSGNAVLIPLSAVGADIGQGGYVFVYDADQGIVKRTPIQTENLLDNKLYVSSGIEPDDIIAVAGVSFLRDGQKVTLLEKNVKLFN